MNRLTQSQENYLRTILVISRRGRKVRQTDIARHLGVSRPSVHTALANLEKNGFVTRNVSRLISLTADGEREAKRIIDSFSVLYLFLTSKLNISPHTACIDAGKLEHVASPETVNALRLLLEKPI